MKPLGVLILDRADWLEPENGPGVSSGYGLGCGNLSLDSSENYIGYGYGHADGGFTLCKVFGPSRGGGYVIGEGDGNGYQDSRY